MYQYQTLMHTLGFCTVLVIVTRRRDIMVIGNGANQTQVQSDWTVPKGEHGDFGCDDE